jgi:hypothetical protein
MTEKPKILFHGTPHRIEGSSLEPRQATDFTTTANSECAVYATDRRDIAIGMSLRASSRHAGFGNFHENPFKHVFLRGEPKETPCFLYTVSSETFENAGLHQWISVVAVPVLSVEELQPEELAEYWRPATQAEKDDFEGRTGEKL